MGVLVGRKKGEDLPQPQQAQNAFMSQPDWKTIKNELNKLSPDFCWDGMAKNLAQNIPEGKFEAFMESMKSLVSFIGKNTTRDTSYYALLSLSNLLSNPDFKPEYLDSFKTAVERIVKNTTGDATSNILLVLFDLLSKSTFRPEYLKTAEWIAKNTTGDATEDASFALSYLISNPNFTPGCIELFDAAADRIVKSTTGEQTAIEFYALSALTFSPSFKPKDLKTVGQSASKQQNR